MKLTLLDQKVLLKVYDDNINQARYYHPLGSKCVKGRLYIPIIGLRSRRHKGIPITQEQKQQIKIKADLEANS